MADWDDVGLYWDTPDLVWDGQTPNPGDVARWIDLVTSEHRNQPNFIAMMTAFLQPLADSLAVATAMATLFDIDTAQGIQLDAIGVWVGRSRFLTVPITGVYFTFDIGPGFDQGILFGSPDQPNELLALPDAQYRTLLYATIAANHWDGTITGAFNISEIVFGPGGWRLVIIDHQDMTMEMVLGGPQPDAVTLALFLGGYLNLRPDGVEVTDYAWNGSPLTDKIFMFDAPADSAVFGGFDEAAFASFAS